MLKNIVVGVDGSPSSHRALVWAAAAATDELHAVHAVSPAMELTAAGFQIDTRPLVEKLTARLSGPWTRGLELGDTKLFTHLVEDSPMHALTMVADGRDAGAIAVGEHGLGPASKMIGVTASRLIHVSEHPIVVVPDRDPSEPTTEQIVVAVSTNLHEDVELVHWARQAARGPDTVIKLVHAMSPGSHADPHRLQSDLRRWVDTLGVGQRCAISVERTDPFTALLDASAQAALIVVGTHRSGRLAAYLTGALANHLPTMSACPVALVPLTAPRP